MPCVNEDRKSQVHSFVAFFFFFFATFGYNLVYKQRRGYC